MHDGPNLVFAPHLDDAVLSCWHVLADRAHDTVVVEVLAGYPDPGVHGSWDLQCAEAHGGFDQLVKPAWDSLDVVVKRRQEEAAAVNHLRVELTFLDGLDSQYGGRTGAAAGRAAADRGRSSLH